jgi:hypothetical protein
MRAWWRSAVVRLASLLALLSVAACNALDDPSSGDSSSDDPGMGVGGMSPIPSFPMPMVSIAQCGNGTLEAGEQCDHFGTCAGSGARSCLQCRLVACPPMAPAPMACGVRAGELQEQACDALGAQCATAYCGFTERCTCSMASIEDAGTEDDDAGTPSTGVATVWLCETLAGPTCP